MTDATIWINKFYSEYLRLPSATEAYEAGAKGMEAAALFDLQTEIAEAVEVYRERCKKVVTNALIDYEQNWVQPSIVAEKAICSLPTTNALEVVKAKARLEEAKWWSENINRYGGQTDFTRLDAHLATLVRLEKEGWK